MTPDRRTLLAATAGLESGSTPTDRTETDPPDATDGTDPTSTPSGGSRLEDLRVDNAGDEPRTLTVRFVPESGEETTLEFSLLVPSDERVAWEDNPLLDDAPTVVVGVALPVEFALDGTAFAGIGDCRHAAGLVEQWVVLPGDALV